MIDLFSAGSAYDCTMPGVVNNEADCQKFWLCKENPEGSRILEVRLTTENLKIYEIYLSCFKQLELSDGFQNLIFLNFVVA